MTPYITNELKCSHPEVSRITETGSVDLDPGGLVSYILTLEFRSGYVKQFIDNYPYLVRKQAEEYLQSIKSELNANTNTTQKSERMEDARKHN